MEYDALNRIIKLTYPEDLDGPPRKELIPIYNKAGALESVEFDGDAYVQHIAYNAKGQRILIAYGNGIMTRYAYDSFTFRLLRQRSESYSESTWTYTSTGNVKQDIAYEYDLVGNIFVTHDNTTGCGTGGGNSLDRDFDYDAIYRLISADGRENAPTITPIWDDSYRSTNNSTTTSYIQNYEYDKVGNITELQHIGNTNFTRVFNYIPASGNVLDSVDIGMSNYAFTYDDCGNQVTETSSRFWEWDSLNGARCFYVMASSSITQYTHYLYDATGKRVKKLTWKTGSIYDSFSYIDGIFEYRTNGIDEQNILHVKDDQSRLSFIRIGDDFGDTTPAVKFNLEDLIGSSIVLLEDDGTNINNEEYYPFGETSFGSYAKKRYKYCGRERDQESGVYYYGARYYSPWTCRFTSIDPKASDYHQLTPYNYVANNPLTYIDPDGKEIVPIGTPEQIAAAKALIEKVGKSEKMQATIDKLQKSDVKYYIIVGSRKEIEKAIGKDVGPTGGGITSYRFGKNEGVIIGIENVVTTPVNQITAMADELKTGEQFEKGKIGFVKVPGEGTFGMGGDPTDELETKIAGADALKVNGLSSADMDGQNSKKIIQAYEVAPKEKDGSISSGTQKELLTVLWGTAYGPNFEKKGMTKDTIMSAEEAAKIEKDENQKNETVIRKDGKTIKN